MTESIPLPVRLTDMREVELEYLRASADERVKMHNGLRFYELLNFGEHFVLERRFPNELGDQPDGNTSEAQKAAWDYRARELVLAMLSYGDEVIRRKMDLVGRVAPDEAVCVLALTGTGSVVELGFPDDDGNRDFIYRPTPRPDQELSEGRAVFTKPIKLGNRMDIANWRTSEILVLATSTQVASSPEADRQPSISAGRNVFSPEAELSLPDSGREEYQVDMVRLRVLVNAASQAPQDERGWLQRRVLEVARKLQAASPDQGFELSELAEFRTGSTARYQVAALPDQAFALARHPSSRWNTKTASLGRAELFGQRVTVGAPLVIEHDGVDGGRSFSVILSVASVVLSDDGKAPSDAKSAEGGTGGSGSASGGAADPDEPAGA